MYSTAVLSILLCIYHFNFGAFATQGVDYSLAINNYKQFHACRGEMGTMGSRGLKGDKGIPGPDGANAFCLPCAGENGTRGVMGDPENLV